MLKGKKKLLAAQVLLGLLVASQAYAADFNVTGIEKGNSNADKVVDNTFYACGKDGYSIADGTVLLGGKDGKFLTNEKTVNENNITIECGGWNFYVIDAENPTGNTVNFGNINQPDEWVHQFGGVTVFKNGGTGNVVNVVKAGIVNWGKIDAGEGNTMNIGSLIAVGTDNDYKLNAGTINVNGSSMGAKNVILSANHININGDNVTVGKVTANSTSTASRGAHSTGGNVNITGNNFKANEVDAAGGQISVLGSGADVDVVKANKLNIGAKGTLKTNNIDNITEVVIDGAANSNALVTTADISSSAAKIKLVNSTDTTSSKLLVQESKITTGANGVTLSKSVTGTQERSKSLVETQIASLGAVMSSADLLSNAGFSNASQAVQQSNAEGGSARKMVPYAAAGYGNMRQESGSHVDVQGSAFNIGFAKEVKNGSGKLLFGPMIEYGRGSYESYLDDGTKGDGNTQNFGLGVMARQNNDNGTYYEGSLRYGKLTSNYNSGDLGADYDTDANYWGAHLGLGKVFQLNDKNSIDTYCKFFYTNQGSSSANISGNNVEFDAVKSKRSRLGFRFNHATSDVRSIYAGLAWQHEFDGSACATVDGFSTPSPSIKGNSMMAELGVNVAPKSSPVSFDLGVSGWAGKQKGYSLNANMLWSF